MFYNIAPYFYKVNVVLVVLMLLLLPPLIIASAADTPISDAISRTDENPSQERFFGHLFTNCGCPRGRRL